MFASNVSDEEKFRHEQANHFCFDILHNTVILSDFFDVEYNNHVPGIIFYCDNTSFDYKSHIVQALERRGIYEYFNIKEYKTSVQVNLKKQYIDNIEKLETVLQLKGFY